MCITSQRQILVIALLNPPPPKLKAILVSISRTAALQVIDLKKNKRHSSYFICMCPRMEDVQQCDGDNCWCLKSVSHLSWSQRTCWSDTLAKNVVNILMSVSLVAHFL